jgi:hypothetical protein
MTHVGYLEDPDPVAIYRRLERVLQLGLARLLVPLLDRRTVRDVITSLVDFEAVQLEMRVEFVQKEGSSLMASTVSFLVGT